MTDTSSGQNAEHWKQKYYDQLDRIDQKEKDWAELESLLKRTVGRLSLAAEGHHKTIDRHMQDIRAAVKDNINRHRLEAILEDLSSLLTKIEEKQKAPNRQIVPVLQHLMEQIALPAQCEKIQKKIIKQLSKATDDDSDAIAKDIIELLRQALLQTGVEDKKPGLFSRLLGTTIETGQQVDISTAVDVAVQMIGMLPWPDEYTRDVESLLNKTRESRDAQAISSNLSQMEKLVGQWKRKLIPAAGVNTLHAESSISLFVKSINNKIHWPKDKIDEVKAFENNLEADISGFENIASQYAMIINSLQKPVEETSVDDGLQLEIYKHCMLSILDKMDNPASPNGKIAALRLSARDAGEKNELDRLTADLAGMLGQTITHSVVDDTSEHDSEQPRIQELLIRLLEQLVVPVDLHVDVEAMKLRLESDGEPSDWKQLLKEVAVLINSIRSRLQQEKHEFEDFLQQITTRLKELDNFLLVETETWKQAEEEGKAFDNKVNSQVQDIREDMVQASDLNQLKSVVENRLDVISKHILKYRNTESQRYNNAQQNVDEMQARMQTLEQETEKLKIIIIEKNKQALSDTLTGIPNRLAFDQRIETEIARWKRFGNPLSIAVWDVDFFKKVNDTYGHKAGDKVLRTIAQLLSKRIRQTDFIARYGGEEFVMLLPGTKEEETLRLVNELRKQVEECGFHYHGKAVTITVSCGVSSFREGEALEQVFERADKALYKAKKNGRNQCVIASVRSD